jgi:hypothetical protein
VSKSPPLFHPNREPMFYEDPAPARTAEWQEELERVVPRQDRLSWLKIVWEPGYPHEPIQRYVLYQMVGFERAPSMVQPYLTGPNPRLFWRWDRVQKEIIRSPDAPLVSHTQWQLYRDTGLFGRPYFVLQGNAGGHKVRWNRAEAMIARTRGVKGGKPPVVGDLPFAELDNRTIERVAQLSLMRNVAYLLDKVHVSAEALEKHEEEEVQRAEDKLWDFISAQAEDTFEDALAETDSVKPEHFAGLN